MQADPLDLRARLALPLLLGLVLLAHAPAFRGTFIYDDYNDIVNNPSAQAGTFLARLAAMSRPLLKATYALQDALHGPIAQAYHALNIALHLATTTLVFGLSRSAATQAGLPAGRAALVAITATAAWALHPSSAETVSYISGRSMGLSTLLLLAALAAATAQRPRPALAVITAFLAPLARETALIAPLLLLVWQICLMQDEKLRPAIGRAAPVWLGALAGGAVLALMPRHQELLAFSLDQRSTLDTLRANSFALPGMLDLWLRPWRISAVPAQPVIYGWSEWPTLVRAGLMVAIPAAALAARRRAPLVALGVLLTLVALLPSNSLIWRVDPLAVRPLYLAGFGLSLLLALVLTQSRAGQVASLFVVLALAAMTFDRARLYSDETALFRDAVAKNVGEPKPLVLLGLALANAGRTREARDALEEALTLDPGNAEAENALRLLDAGAPIYRTPAP